MTTVPTCKLNTKLTAECTYIPHSYDQKTTNSCKTGQVVMKDRYISGDLYCLDIATKSEYVTAATGVACPLDVKETKFDLALIGDYCELNKAATEGCANSLHPSDGKCACTTEGKTCAKDSLCLLDACIKPIESANMNVILTDKTIGMCGSENCTVGKVCYSSQKKSAGNNAGSVCLPAVTAATEKLNADSYVYIETDKAKTYVQQMCFAKNGADKTHACKCADGAIGPCYIDDKTSCKEGQKVSLKDAKLTCTDSTDAATAPSSFAEISKAVKCGSKVMNEWKAEACNDGKAYPLCSLGFPASEKCFCSVNGVAGQTASVLSSGQVCLGKTIIGCSSSQKEEFSYDANKKKIEKCTKSSKSNTTTIIIIIVAVIVVLAIVAGIAVCLHKKNSTKSNGKPQQIRGAMA